MHNTRPENLSEHTLECAFITYYLAAVGNAYFDKSYDKQKLVMYALFHDATEILTGDLPTPVKYFNKEIKTTYKEIEQIAANKLLSYLPDTLADDFGEYLNVENLSYDEKLIIKSADKLSAYIKCIQEIDAGNKEFTSATKSTENAIRQSGCVEADYFMDKCIEPFLMSIDDLNTSL